MNRTSTLTIQQSSPKVAAPCNLQSQPEEFYSILLADEKHFSIVRCLAMHCIAPEYRSKMIDWMIEVTTQFDLSSQTFFLCHRIMDRYFKLKTDTQLQAHELHEIGTTCIWIASKVLDITPLFLRTVVKNIGQGKFTTDNIRNRELDILMTLDFDLTIVTPLDFLDALATEFDSNDIVYRTAQCLIYLSAIYYDFLDMSASQHTAIAVSLALMSGGLESLIEPVFDALDFQNLEMVQVAFQNLLDYKKIFPELLSAFKFLCFKLETVNGSVKISFQKTRSEA